VAYGFWQDWALSNTTKSRAYRNFGGGQTYLAIALGYRAAQDAIKTRFTGTADLLLMLTAAHAEHQLKSVMHGLQQLSPAHHRRDRLSAHFKLLLTRLFFSLPAIDAYANISSD
jgi:hypothetical protein